MISVGSEVQILPGPPIRNRRGMVVVRLDYRQAPGPLGDVAQLGEHLLCKQGVVGSIPIVSTIMVDWADYRLRPMVRSMIRVCVSQRSKRFGAGCGVVRDGPVGTIRRAWLRHCWCCHLTFSGWRQMFFVRVNQVLVRLWTRVMARPVWAGAVPSRNRESDRIVVCSAGVGDVQSFAR